MSFNIPIRIDEGNALPTIAKVEAALDRVEGKGTSAGKAVSTGMREGSFATEKLRAEADKTSTAMSRIGNSAKMALGAAVAGAGVREIAELADAYTSMENRMRGVTNGGRELAMMMDATRAAADRSRASWTSTAESYVSMRGATKSLGLSQEQTLLMTERLAKVTQMAGGSAAGAENAITQLMQGLGSGALRGEEFNSVMEGMLPLADMIAAKMGVTTGALRKLAGEGKITAKVITDTLLGVQGEGVDAKFAASSATLAQGWNLLKNELVAIAGTVAPLLADGMAVVSAAIKGALSLIGPLIDGTRAVIGAVKSMSIVGEGTDIRTELDQLLAKMDPLQRKWLEASSVSQTMAVAIEVVSAKIEKQRQEWMEITPEGQKYRLALDGVTAALKENADWLDRANTKTVTYASAMKAARGVLAVAGAASGATDPWNGGLDGFWKRVEEGGKLETQMASAKAQTDDIVASWRALLDSRSRFRQAVDGGIGAGIGAVSGGTYDAKVAAGLAQLELDSAQATERASQPDLARDLAAHDGGMTPWAVKAEADKERTTAWIAELERAKTSQSELGRAWDSTVKQMTDTAGALEQAITGAFRGMEDAFVSLVTTGKADWKAMVNSMISDLVRLAFRRLAAGIIGAISPGAGAAVSLGAAKAGGNFAFGGGYRVGGSGGPDSQNVMFKLTPGEHVQFTPPGGMPPTAAQTSAPSSTTLNVHIDSAGNVTHDNIEGLVIRVLDRNSPALRSRFTGR